MKKFRILHTDSSHGLGGQEYRVLSEAKAMGLRGHQVVIAAPGNSQLTKLAKQEGLHCEAIPVGISGWGRLVPLFLKLLVKHKIQIVHTHGSQDSWTASLAARLSSSRPVIVRARHKSTPVSVSFRHNVLYRFLPHAVTTTGEAVRQQLIVRNSLNPDSVFSIPTGVDMKRFHSWSSDVALKEALGIQVGQPVVGTVSFLRPEKGLNVLIDAVSLLQKEFSRVCCLIVGTGQGHQRLLEQIRLQKNRWGCRIGRIPRRYSRVVKYHGCVCLTVIRRRDASGFTSGIGYGTGRGRFCCGGSARSRSGWANRILGLPTGSCRARRESWIVIS